jgi:hypothetical protein
MEIGKVALPQIQLVHGLVVNIGTDTLSNVEAITLSLASLAESLLFIGDIMLCARNNSGILNSSDGGINQGTGQIRIGTESFLQELLDTFNVQRSKVHSCNSPSSCPLLEPDLRVHRPVRVAHQHLYRGAPRPLLVRVRRQDHETR